MLLLLPNRAPDGHIVKAAVEQPGDCLLLFEGVQRLAHCLERFLHFFGFDFQSRAPDY
jgi:hypothetical protein